MKSAKFTEVQCSMLVKLRKGIAWNYLHDGTFDTDVCEGHTSTTTGNVSAV